MTQPRAAAKVCTVTPLGCAAADAERRWRSWSRPALRIRQTVICEVSISAAICAWLCPAKK
jgi:hypothetical protein